MPAETPAAGSGPARSVQLHIDQTSVPVDVDDLVAALWVAAETGDLDPARVQSDDEADDLARAVVLYLLLTHHADIVDARRQLAAVPPGTPWADIVDNTRRYAIDLFTTPDPGWDLGD